jgi:hypothetical protein
MKIIPQSSAEAETVAYTGAAKDLRFVINVLSFLEASYLLPIPIRCDNSATVTSMTTPGVKARTRHYESWMWYGRRQYLEAVSTPQWVPTAEQIADIFTKALEKPKFVMFRNICLGRQASATVKIDPPG